MTVTITFKSADGSASWQGTAEPGERLLEVGQGLNVPLEGTCEGVMACSTCHVIVDPAFAALLPPPSEEELDMLDFAYGVSATSRLACQIRLSESVDGLLLHLPKAARNMMAR